MNFLSLAIATLTMAAAIPAMDIISSSPSDVSLKTDVSYSCKLVNRWTAKRHPVGYPGNAHWSPPVMVAHSDMYTMWKDGDLATFGMEQLAELGATSKLAREIKAAGVNTGLAIVGRNQFDEVQTLPSVQVSKKHHLLSLATMMAPSPDWFTGLYNFDLRSEEDTWLRQFVVETYPWDAGTEQGKSFSLDNPPESPHMAMFQHDDKTFPFSGTIPSVARFECHLEPPKYAIIRVRVINRAPDHGTCLTPPWVGVHDGQFDIYDPRKRASKQLERLAEDGNNSPISELFLATNGTVGDGTVGGSPICPGETQTLKMQLQLLPNTNLYFSFATMILPSNDAFLANANPTMYLLFNDKGMFQPTRINQNGGMALDAGTEENNERPRTTAFFGQTKPNTGRREKGGKVRRHPGLKAPGSGGIVDSKDFANADFTMPGYRFMTIRVSLVE